MNRLTKFLVFIAIVLGISNCKNYNYHKELIRIEVVSKLANCEENNIHFKVTKVYNADFVNITDSFILPICKSDKCKENIYVLNNNDTLNRFLLTGYLSIEGHNNVEYGCVGSKLFKVVEVTELSNLKPMK